MRALRGRQGRQVREVLSRNDQHVAWRDCVKIRERDHVVVFVEKFRAEFAGDDIAENARLVHGLLSDIRLKSSAVSGLGMNPLTLLRKTVGGALCAIGTTGAWSCTRSSARR